MKKNADFIVKFRHLWMLIFIACIATCGFLIPKVKTNYNLIEYLPGESEAVIALNKMEKEFGASGTAQVMVDDIDLSQANTIKVKLENIDGVASVIFDATSENYFKDNSAMFKIFLSHGNYETEAHQTVKYIRACLSEYKVYMNGESVSSNYLQGAVQKDMLIILLAACAVILVILLLTSSSWLDPLVFLIVVASAILINMGTNIWMGSISFITGSICAVMQLALSMDYSIILLHRFTEEKTKTTNKKEAMARALAKTFAPVSASSLTTIAGLVALMFMSFTIGFDIGMVLAKGILISLIDVFLFMPGILLMLSKALDKTQHVSLYQKIKDKIKVGRAKKSLKYESYNTENPDKKEKKVHTFTDFQWKTRIIVPIIAVVLIICGAGLQFNLKYSFSVKTSKDPNEAVSVEDRNITEKFGEQNTLVIMLPKGDSEKEKELTRYLLGYESEGEKVISGGLGMAAAGLRDIYTATQLSQIFGIDENLVNLAFAAQGKDKVELYSFLQYLNESSFITDFASQTIASFNEKSKEISKLFAQINIKEAVSLYGLSQEQASQIFNSILGSAPDENSKVYNYQIISALHGMGVIEVDELYNGYLTATKQLSKQEILRTYTFLNENMVDLLLNGNASIENYKVINFVLENNIIGAYATNLKAVISAKTSEANYAAKMYESETYSRIIFNLNLPIASDRTFAVIEDLRENVSTYYEENYILTESASFYDIQQSFNNDNLKISLISFFAIFLIILFTFKSISIPILLSILIQGSIWLTMSFNAMLSSPIFFVCYLVVMCIQMGATIDYAILLTSRYSEARKTMDRKQSMAQAFDASLITILTSGSILVIAAFIVGLVSKVSIISSLGLLLARGCLISLILIAFVLPQILLLCDKFIQKTTFSFTGKKNKKAKKQEN